MKILISAITILGIVTTLLGNKTSIANELSSQKKTEIIAENSGVEEFIVSGNEPFWSVTISRRGIIYSLPGKKQQIFTYVQPLKAEGRPANLVRVYKFGERKDNILILKKVNRCSDTMSDINYPYSAVLILGNKILEGCANKK